MNTTPQAGASSKVCACYISDDGYLFPSLISAVQLKRNTLSTKTDVVMYHIGSQSQKSESFRSLYEQNGIGFFTIPADAIDNMHVMFARLFVDRFVDPRYEQILYLDGDTQIAGSLDPLLDVRLPPGYFCAARDPMSLSIDWKDRASAAQRAYFKSIGLSTNRLRSYFNSGVLRVDRQSWTNISADVLREVTNKKTNFRFPDQDALNLVAGDRHLAMSFKWNFPVFLLNIGLDKIVQPRIYHFMSNPRPWQGPFQPWGAAWHTVYLDMIATYPQLLSDLPKLTRVRYLKYFLQQQYKKRIESMTWRRQDVLDSIDAVESAAFV